jgi:sugar lactone lactonase YvrE
MNDARMKIHADCVLDVQAKVGECPVWAEDERALYWVDIQGPTLNRFEPATGRNQAWQMPSLIGSFALRRDGGAIVALKTGIYLFDFATAHLSQVGAPEAHLPGNRMNDGKAGPDGRFWVGSMDDRWPDKEPTGALYRVNADLTIDRIVQGLICSNGLAWSPDGRTLYHSDSRLNFVCAYDYDPPSGAIANRRDLRYDSKELGRPDGGTVDREGCYWVCGVSAGRINRFRPDGTLDKSLELPVPSPTNCCFGGPDFRTLYITTKRYREDPAVVSANPKMGGIFAADVGVSGSPAARFAG